MQLRNAWVTRISTKLNRPDIPCDSNVAWLLKQQKTDQSKQPSARYPALRTALCPSKAVFTGPAGSHPLLKVGMGTVGSALR